MKEGKKRLGRGLRATFLGMAINLVLAAFKLLAGIYGHSQALIADAVESFADVFSSIVVWRGLVLASEPADEDHPYGHGKAEPIATAIVSTMLLLAATGIALAAFREILEPRGRGPEPFTLMVLIAVVAVKEGLFRWMLREAGTVESSAIRSDAWHHRSDAITSLAAAMGISIALLGGPAFAMADSAAAIFAAGIIAWNGWRLLRPALDELMDMTPDLTLNLRIKEIAAGISGVEEVEKCLVRKMGYHYFVDMHVRVDPRMTVERAHNIAHQVKDKVMEEIPAVHDVLVHIEPRGGKTARKHKR